MRLLLFNLATDADDPLLGFATRWIEALAQRVEFIHVVTMRAGRVSVPDNVRVYSVGKEKGYSEPRRALEFYRQLGGILRHDRVDVCFSHMIPLFTILGAPLLRLARVPTVVWYAHRHVSRTVRVAHRLAARVVTSAPTAYQYRRDKVVVVGQGIDTTSFCPAETGPGDRPFLLSVGRLSPIKDPLTLVRAVHRLRARGYDLDCVLVGDAPADHRAYAADLRETVASLGLSAAVRFAGAVPQTEVVSWHQQCFAHVNLCPSGALDKAVLEAMACARPSLVANDGFGELLGPWKDQLLFRHADADSLVGQIERLVKLRSEDRSGMGAALRQSVIQHHSLDRLADRLVQLFDDVRGSSC